MTTEYQILRCSTSSRLVDLVNSAIKQGWQPVDGVVFVQANSLYSTDTFMQAIIKESNAR
jgi:hypothetical protein